MRIIAHISDSHLNAEPERLERLERVVAYLKSSEAILDAVIFTGDVSDNGRVDEYRAAALALRPLRVPVLFCPGNHDRRDAFSQVLETSSGLPSGHLNSRHDSDDLTLLTLDSLLEGDDGGALHPTTLEWLE